MSQAGRADPRETEREDWSRRGVRAADRDGSEVVVTLQNQAESASGFALSGERL